jgi:alginate O-acetyltransferase complex protein AlgI
MAIGLGRMFGFKFLENFNYPYISRSITEFWNRWHMSLQTWIRDYLFNPLGGIRKGKRRVVVNLLTVFFLAGLWHGASWNFVFFGLFQGVLLISEQMFFKKILRRSWRPLQHIYVLLMLFITLVMFRNENLAYMLNTLKVMVGFGSSISLPLWSYIDYKVIVAGVVGVVFSMPVVPYFKKMIIQSQENKQRKTHFLLILIYYTIYFVLVILCFQELTVTGKNPFIYFRF